MAITDFLSLKVTLLIVFLLALIIALVILFLIQKKLKKKIIVKKQIEKKGFSYLNELNQLKTEKESNEEILSSLSSLARNFFIEEFEMHRGLDYGEMISIFKQKNMNDKAEFCRRMLESLYSEEKVERQELEILINSLEKIIREQHPEIKEETNQQQIEMPKEIPALAKTPIRFPLIPRKEEMRIWLSTMNEEQIRDAYKELQKRFELAYTLAKKRKDKIIIEKLDKYRAEIHEKIDNYKKVPTESGIIELIQEMKKGVMIVNSLIYTLLG